MVQPLLAGLQHELRMLGIGIPTERAFSEEKLREIAHHLAHRASDSLRNELASSGMVNEEGELTEMGYTMLRFLLSVSGGRMVFKRHYSCWCRFSQVDHLPQLRFDHPNRPVT